MKKIPELNDEDVQALTDYVIYLSMRGELERALIDGAALDLDLEGGDRVIDTEFGRDLSDQQGTDRKTRRDRKSTRMSWSTSTTTTSSPSD